MNSPPPFATRQIILRPATQLQREKNASHEAEFQFEKVSTQKIIALAHLVVCDIENSYSLFSRFFGADRFKTLCLSPLTRQKQNDLFLYVVVVVVSSGHLKFLCMATNGITVSVHSVRSNMHNRYFKKHAYTHTYIRSSSQVTTEKTLQREKTNSKYFCCCVTFFS